MSSVIKYTKYATIILHLVAAGLHVWISVLELQPLLVSPALVQSIA